MDETTRRDEDRDTYTRQPSSPAEENLSGRSSDDEVVHEPRTGGRNPRSLTDRERRERWPIG